MARELLALVQTGSHATRKLEKLPQRPPTPPRLSGNSKLHAGSSATEAIFSNDGLHSTVPTPLTSSPASSDTSSKRTIDKSHKRVAWSAWSEFGEVPHKKPAEQCNLRQLPPSGELKPAKSILKPYSGVNSMDPRNGTNKFAAPHTHPNFATMLESIIQQLDGEDRGSRIDAYLTLAGVLKASENIPDPQALREKISLLTQFINRDLLAKTISGTADTGLISNALTLLSFFVWKPGVAGHLSIEFCTSFIEHSISAFGDDSVPKEVLKHLLFIVGQQNFSPRIMTSDRIRRLIQSMTEIQNRVKGRSILLGRVVTYQKLLRQSATSMLTNLAWIENMFTDMISPLKDVRIHAIALGFEAALLLGTEKQASRAVTDLFQRQHNGTKYVDYYATKLYSMIPKKGARDPHQRDADGRNLLPHEGSLVPQIWSIVILFLRFRPHQLEQWEFITPWLHIIEKCLNSSHSDMKMQANSAWNRLVFAIQPDEATAPTMIKMLSNVLIVQQRRKLVGKNVKEIKSIRIGSICNLLYYAMRPNASSAQLDLYWDEYVLQLIGNMLVSREQENSEAEQEDLTHACEIMAALLDASPRAWFKNRVHDSRAIGTAEVPGIDPKWIRRNAHRVFKVLNPLFEKCFRDLAKWKDSVILLWSRFMGSVAAAGAKEVKVSSDTMSSLACLLTMLYKLWDRGPQNPSRGDDRQHFQQVFSLLITTITNHLGVLPFTEKLLLMGPQENFEIVFTPSRSPLKPRGEAKCPLHHILALMARPPVGLRYDDALIETVREIFDPFFESRRSRSTQIELARDLAQRLPPSTFNPHACIILWQALAKYATLAIPHKGGAWGNGSGSGSGSHEQPLGTEYRNLAKLLEIGLKLSPSVILCDWRDLFTAAANQITLEAGDSGRAIALIEPLAEVLVDCSSSINTNIDLAYGSLLLSNAAYPGEKHELDAAKRRLWGTLINSSKTSLMDPYSLHVYIRHRLWKCYWPVAGESLENDVNILSDVSDLIKNCPTTRIVGLLKNVQEGLVPWIVDNDARFDLHVSSTVGRVVDLLWKRVCSAIQQLPDTGSALLRVLEPLIRAGLESKHEVMVNSTVILWNSTFGRAKVLDYPAQIMEALRQLQTVTELQLPSVPTESRDEWNSPGLNFLDESQDEMPSLVILDVTSHSPSRGGSARLEPSPLPRPNLTTSLQVVKEVSHLGSKKRRFEGTPEPKRKIAKKEATPILRHDSSQIHFAAISSSPLSETAIDSQLLTDRQLEVKERQIEAGALFANLGSNPGFKIKSRVPKLTTRCDLRASSQEYADDSSGLNGTGQTLGPLDISIASPTRPSRTRGARSLNPFFYPPPIQQGLRLQKQYTNEASLPDLGPEEKGSPSRESWHELIAPNGRPRDAPSTWSTLQEQAQMVKHVTDGPDGEYSIENSINDDPPKARFERPSTPIASNNSQASEDYEVVTPKEVYVDALSSPAPPTPGAREPASDEFQSATEILWLQQGSSRKPKATSCNSPTQVDSQASYFMSDADDDSILRLITRYDDASDSPLQLEADVVKEDHYEGGMSRMDASETFAARHAGSQNYGEGQLTTSHGRNECAMESSSPLEVDALFPSTTLECHSGEGIPARLKNNEPPSPSTDSPLHQVYHATEVQPNNGGIGEVVVANMALPATPKGHGEADNSSREDLPQTAGREMIRRCEELLETLRTACLTREEAQEAEEILWDVKGELYAAEKRGRRRVCD